MSSGRPAMRGNCHVGECPTSGGMAPVTFYLVIIHNYNILWSFGRNQKVWYLAAWPTLHAIMRRDARTPRLPHPVDSFGCNPANNTFK